MLVNSNSKMNKVLEFIFLRKLLHHVCPQNIHILTEKNEFKIIFSYFLQYISMYAFLSFSIKFTKNKIQFPFLENV